MSYASIADLITRKDVTLVMQLASDDGVMPSRADLLTDANVQAALDDASGDIEAALLAANRYSTTDLSGLTGNSLALLKRLVCDIAIAYLYDRRPLHDVNAYEQYTKLKQAHLDRLKNGENVFNLDTIKAAGLPTISGPTSVDYERINLLREHTPHYYPARSHDLPTDRG